MNKNRIEKMIPNAMDELKTIGILTDDGRLPSNYSGYIDSYGPTIRQSGLMQAVAFNEKVKREKINSLIKLVLEKRGYIETTPNKKLIDIVKEASNNSEEKAKLQRLILEAITACKHAMRTFPKIIVKDSD
jgi:CRISPR-associated protein Cmr5